MPFAMKSIPKCLILVVLILVSCNELPEVKSLSEFKQTEFVPTLEHPIKEHKNIIYAAASLYAWDKVRQELKGPIITDSINSADFKLLMQSTSHQHSLRPDEYSADVKIIDGEIFAEAFFYKTLPFQISFKKSEIPLLFGTQKVDAFGVYNFDQELFNNFRILYYDSDNSFVLKLLPKDEQHEIILAKGLNKMSSLGKAVKEINELIEKGGKERKDPEQSWKYAMIEEDMFSLPSIQFNIETSYKQLEGQRFSVNGKKHTIEGSRQRTVFVLNENGAIAESQAMSWLDSVGIAHPKKMIFDKPFYIILKRVDANNPYFVMKVDNTELMIVP
jgi:hypothetical protein